MKEISVHDLVFLQKYIPQLDLNSIKQTKELFEKADHIDETSGEIHKEHFDLVFSFFKEEKNLTATEKMKKMILFLKEELNKSNSRIAFYQALTMLLAQELSGKSHLRLIKK